MTSEEIKQAIRIVKNPDCIDQLPLWEIAYQFAVMNEKNTATDDEAVRRGIFLPQPNNRDWQELWERLSQIRAMIRTLQPSGPATPEVSQIQKES